MRISELKLNKIRKEFLVDINGDVEKITVYNLLGEERGNVIDVIQDMVLEKDTLDDEDVEKIYNIIFPLCTDLEFDERIVNVINNPSVDMVRVINEILEIYNELYVEILYAQIRRMAEIEQATLTKYLLLKTQKIELLNQDCYSLEKEIRDTKRINERLAILEEKQKIEREIELENEELEGE